MPKQVGKSGVAGKLSKALQRHASDETVYGRDFIELPAGIVGGIAKLVDAKIGIYQSGANKGNQFVYLAGTVIEPKEFDAIKQVYQNGAVVNLPIQHMVLDGQRTSQLLPLCDTTTGSGDTIDVDTHVERMLNELRKLGGEDFTESISDEESLEAALEALKEARPYFRFSTTSSPPTAAYPNERVWENWRGSKGLEDYEPEGVDDVDDQTEEAPLKKATKQVEKEDTETDFHSLGEAADNDDEEAQQTLAKLAEEQGIEYESAPSWFSVAQQLAGSSTTTDRGDETPDSDGWEPKKEEIYFFTPPRSKKRVEVEVTAVFTDQQTCNVKSLDDGKTFKAVPWDRLETE